MTLDVAGLPFDGAGAPLDLEPVTGPELVDGDPATGYRVLGAIDDRELGVWEITPGVVTDVESDEVFVVIAGEATVEFADGRPTLELRPGVVAALRDGDATTWTVRTTLRKIVVS
jgi:uncharacterized protein